MPYFLTETQPVAVATGDIWEKPSNHAKKYWNGTSWLPLSIFPVYIELRPDLDFETIRGNNGVPRLVTQGIFRGFSLPIYNSNDEELFNAICVPNRYDGASDIAVHLYCWLDSPEDSRNFKLQLSWNHFTPGVDVVPATTHDVPVQTATGAGAAQFKSFKVAFIIDYDIDAPDNIVADDILQVRLRRVAADASEIDGEVVVNHYGIVFQRDKLGAEAI